MDTGEGRAVGAILDRHGRRPENLLQVLREIQEEFGHVPPAAVRQVARELNVPLAQVRGVVEFYAFLSLTPQGRYRVLFSDNITDRMQGNLDLLEYFCGRLLIERGHVSEDGLVSVDTTSCTGMCDQGPAILVNGRAIPRINRERLDRIADLIVESVPLADWPAELFVIDDNIHRADMLLGSDLRPGEAVGRALAMGSSAILDAIKAAGLRGRGGAGFATGVKWQACRDAPGARRYVVCNADEGEPGTFKDRVLLSRYADLVFDGMTVCAHALGASRGFLYLRGEYRYLLERLETVLAARRAAGLLGVAIGGEPGFDFDIHIHLGAGAYICGEESALIESLEGKRGIPRNRPPYPVTHGYLQSPTTVNNVETFCAAAFIVTRGAEAFRAQGTATSTGTKIVSISGDCARPGIYEYPFGTRLRDVLDDCGAADIQAVQVSGPSGTCVGADELERRIAFEDLATAGAITLFDRSRDIFEVAANYTAFFAHESCGFCTPCRVGTAMLAQLMEKIGAGRGTYADLAEIEALNRVLGMSAHCGLGHTACNPTLDTLKRFRPAWEARMTTRDFIPAFDLDGALARARQMTGRDDAGAHLQSDVDP